MSVRCHKGSRDEVGEAMRRSCYSHNPPVHLYTNHTCRYQTTRVDFTRTNLEGLIEVI
jgi:hypothetical protein